jgi:SOS-response transcriptional repressor LexA
MNNFGKRVKERRKLLGLTQMELAARAGLSQTTISDIERGRNESSIELISLARVLECQAEWLKSGKISRNTHHTLGSGGSLPSIQSWAPLISWEEAIAYCSDETEEPSDDSGAEYLPCLKRLGPRAFALRLEGDSMVSPHPGSRSYPAGSIIFVDPDQPIVNGSRVIARIAGEDSATFKEYREDGARRYLKPLNPQYPTLTMTDDTLLCGAVVGSWIDD